MVPQAHLYCWEGFIDNAFIPVAGCHAIRVGPVVLRHCLSTVLPFSVITILSYKRSIYNTVLALEMC